MGLLLKLQQIFLMLAATNKTAKSGNFLCQSRGRCFTAPWSLILTFLQMAAKFKQKQELNQVLPATTKSKNPRCALVIKLESNFGNCKACSKESHLSVWLADDDSGDFNDPLAKAD